MLSGILFSIAAVSRLMEIIIIVIHPTAIFLLRQSTNLIIVSITIKILGLELYFFVNLFSRTSLSILFQLFRI